MTTTNSTSTLEQQFIEAVKSGRSREHLGRMYADVIRDGAPHQWFLINGAILERFSPSGLAYIKKVAWRELGK